MRNNTKQIKKDRVDFFGPIIYEKPNPNSKTKESSN